MRKIFSILFWSFLGLLWSFSFFVCLLTFLVTIPFDRNTRILHYISCFFLFGCVYLNPFWRVRFEGRKKLPSHGGAILVAAGGYITPEEYKSRKQAILDGM